MKWKQKINLDSYLSKVFYVYIYKHFFLKQFSKTYNKEVVLILWNIKRTISFNGNAEMSGFMLWVQILSGIYGLILHQIYNKGEYFVKKNKKDNDFWVLSFFNRNWHDNIQLTRSQQSYIVRFSNKKKIRVADQRYLLWQVRIRAQTYLTFYQK